MKISNTTNNPNLEIPRHSNVNGGPRTGDADQPGRTTDRVELSAAGQIVRPSNLTPEFRADKVQEMQAAIANKTFRVDTEVLAQRMIYESASLLQTLSGATTTDAPAATDNRSNQNSQESFGANPAKERGPGPDR